MPLTDKGREILAQMEKEYGTEKGSEVFYASAKAGTITGVHDAEEELDPAKLDTVVGMCQAYDQKDSTKLDDVMATCDEYERKDGAYETWKAGGKGMSETDKRYYSSHEKKARSLIEQLRDAGYRKEDVVPMLVRGWNIRAPYNVADTYEIAKKILGEYRFGPNTSDKKLERSSIGWTQYAKTTDGGKPYQFNSKTGKMEQKK